MNVKPLKVSRGLHVFHNKKEMNFVISQIPEIFAVLSVHHVSTLFLRSPTFKSLVSLH